MKNMNITFFDDNEASLHERILARLVAEALLFKVRIADESDAVKQEKRELTATKQVVHSC